jgi:hypothetical protein
VLDLHYQPAERRIRCRTSDRCRPTGDGKLHYWIIGDWRRGRQYPVAPTVDNWNRQLHDLGQLLLDDVNLTIDPSEAVQ